MEVARYWRLRKQRYRLEGVKKTDNHGNKLISVSGSSWVDAPSNGRPEEEPLIENIVYEAPSLEGNNGGNGHNHKPISAALPAEAVPATG